MKWTKDLPKKAGWYWWKEDGQYVLPSVVLIEMHGKTNPLSHFSDGRFPETCSYYAGWYAGPISAPEGDLE